MPVPPLAKLNPLGGIAMAEATIARRAVARSAMHKAFWRILPLILIAYLLAYMDRVNVSFAAASMNEDLAFSATIYGLGGGLFFLGYALFEIPSNLMLVRFGARKWIARIMITWGLLSAAMMFVETPLQFYALRFLLGVAEAGFYPGVIFYFSAWFPPCHRSRAVSRFFVASPLASVVMGAMSGWLLVMRICTSLFCAVAIRTVPLAPSCPVVADRSSVSDVGGCWGYRVSGEVTVVPFQLAEIVTVVVCDTSLVGIVTGVENAPAATSIVAGGCATGESLDRLTVAPPGGTRPVNARCPPASRPLVLSQQNVSAFSVDGRTVKAKEDEDEPRVAVRVAGVCWVTSPANSRNVVNADPAGTVT